MLVKMTFSRVARFVWLQIDCDIQSVLFPLVWQLKQPTPLSSHSSTGTSSQWSMLWQLNLPSINLHAQTATWASQCPVAVAQQQKHFLLSFHTCSMQNMPILLGLFSKPCWSHSQVLPCIGCNLWIGATAATNWNTFDHFIWCTLSESFNQTNVLNLELIFSQETLHSQSTDQRGADSVQQTNALNSSEKWKRLWQSKKTFHPERNSLLC